MLKEIGSVLSFLTIIPSPHATLENVAKCMYLFPMVGIVIGLLVGGFGFGLSFLLDPLLASLLIVASISIITGMHHADGLADFVDGLAATGSKDKKIKAMKDLAVGSAGVAGTVLYLAGLIITLSLVSGFDLFRAILISEILAKFSMVLMASLGNSAVLGSSSPFVEAMKDRRRLVVAFVIMIIPVAVIGESVGMLMLAAAVVLTIALFAISARSFGGITGDVLGTANEITRLSSLMVFVSI